MVEAMLAGESEAIIRALIEGAISKDPVCMRLALERLYPAPKERAVTLPIPEVGELDLVELERLVIREMAAARLTPTEAATALAVIRRHREAPETVDPMAEEVYPIDLKLIPPDEDEAPAMPEITRRPPAPMAAKTTKKEI